MSRLSRPCLGCGELIPAGSYCSQCQPAPAVRDRAKTAERGYDAQWRRTAARILKRDAFRCRLELDGCTESATTVDHLTPLSKGGSSQPTNLVAACRHCNSVKRDRGLDEVKSQSLGA